MRDAAEIKDAATVIVLRSSAAGEFEVLLTRRPAGMAFLGGMYVFPGGAVRDEDCIEPMLRRCRGVTPNRARDLLGAHLTPQRALGHWIAAVRELYEETGILLAAPERESGARPNRRRAPAEKSVSFQSRLEAERLCCDASAMAYFSHWQTPESFPVRYDARFFIAPLPEGQLPLPNTAEVSHAIWTTPDRALAFFGRGELPMIFPTYASLRALADYDSLESLLREYRGEGPVQ